MLHFDSITVALIHAAARALILHKRGRQHSFFETRVFREVVLVSIVLADATMSCITWRRDVYQPNYATLQCSIEDI